MAGITAPGKLGAGWRALALVASVLCDSGAPALAERAAPVRSLAEIRQDRVVIQQWDTSCGAAALATLLKYQHGLDVSEKQIAQGMLRRTDPLKVKVRGGFSLLDLKRYADASGLEGTGYMEVQFEQ